MFIHLLCIRKAHFKYGMKERKVSKKQTRRRLEINCLKKNAKKEKLQNHNLTLGDLSRPTALFSAKVNGVSFVSSTEGCLGGRGGG